MPKKATTCKQKKIAKPQESARVKCKFCSRTFASHTAIGGHISKKHPGMSKEYARKIVTRVSRTEERELLELAKLAILKVDQKVDLKTHRSLLASVKRLLKAEKDKDVTTAIENYLLKSQGKPSITSIMF